MTAQLLLQELSITNYKAYRGTHTLTLDNAPGVYLLRGENRLNPALDSNGAGKSSLEDAITWCLYGKTLRDEKPGATVEPWTGEKKTSVTVSFSIRNEEHQLTRGRKPNLLLMDGGEVIQQDIDDLLGLSYTAFLCSIILPQFGERFLDLPPEKQAKLFSETLNLDMWLRASENASALARMAQADADEAQSGVDRSEGALQELTEQLAREKARSAGHKKAHAEVHAGMVAALAEAKKAHAAEKAKLSKPVGIPTVAALEAGDEAVAILCEQLQLADEEVADYATLIAQADQELASREATLAEYEATPETCPTCGTKVKAGHFKKLITTIRDELALLDSDRALVLGAQTNLLATAKSLREQIASKEQALLMGRQKKQSADDAESRHYTLVAALAQQVTDGAFAVAKHSRETNPFIAGVAEVEQRIADADALLAEQQAAVAEAEYSKQCYTFWADGYRQIRLDQIDELLAALEEAANINAAELGLEGWRLEFVTEKETTSGKLSRGFSTLLYPPGHDQPVRWESFCGVEVQIWQLAVRFALSELLLAHAGLDPNIEFLDEPTQHLSPGVIDNLMSCLAVRAQRLGRQIWLVEHHVLDTGQFEGMITVAHDAEGSHLL